MLDDALRAAEIDRTRVYVTNTVKHFKWVPRGKLRLHKQPNARKAPDRDARFEELVADLVGVRHRLESSGR